jgi:hypothetical protein
MMNQANKIVAELSKATDEAWEKLERGYMNQSIEDASRIEFEKTGMGKSDFVYFDKVDNVYKASASHHAQMAMDKQRWWEGWQAARQSSQSEPVAVFRNTDDRYFVEFPSYDGLENIPDKSPLFLAAPQQAIPSGWKFSDAEVLEWNSRNDDKFQGKVHEARTAIEDARSMHMLSASPTAPIERDK